MVFPNFITNPTQNMRKVSPFGPRVSTNTLHAGVDLGPIKPGVSGDPLIEVVGGVVRIAKINSGGITTGYGNYVIVEHRDVTNQPWCTLYGHQKALEVRVGQIVKASDVIGHMGYTGHCIPVGEAGTHLHFEVRLCSADKYFTTAAVNPEPYFTRIIASPTVVGAGPTVLYDVSAEEMAALEKLVTLGVISSKDYWLKVMENTKYFDQFVLNVAKRL